MDERLKRDGTTAAVFGAGGDLTRRKLIPALDNNYRKGGLYRVSSIMWFTQNILFLRFANTVRAHYDGYCSTDEVAPDSVTPTFASMRLAIDNRRRHGVQFSLRSGKALAGRMSEIIVRFRQQPGTLFNPRDCERYLPNTVTNRVQPDESICVEFQANTADEAISSRTVEMDFSYKDVFPDRPLPEAYERLVINAIDEDASLFARSDGIAASWRIVDPILRVWESDSSVPPMETRTPGSRAVGFGSPARA